MSIIYKNPRFGMYKNFSPLPVFGKQKSTFYTTPIKFDFSNIFSNDSTGMLVCQTTVTPLSFLDRFLTYNVYEIENGTFKLKDTFDSPDDETGQSRLKIAYDLDCKGNVTE